ncbi:translation initiation factor eIF-2B subunit delta [Drosophila obscura]|uniref:translation initiation factor eIF-2B subunit delta n=1 Tax=Drosophila obscura TaxID=7282 RepID=UPI001BB169C6|nr:translation initiation factor eIF-2B subunit delta [Drosophila obscura]
MASGQYPSRIHSLPPVLLLLLLFLGVSLSQSPVRVPPLELQTPNFGGESFERFEDATKNNNDNNDNNDNNESSEMKEQLTQLLGEKLANAFAPLAATPFSQLSQRRPGIVAPTSGAQARAQFTADDDSDSGEQEESQEEDESSSSEEEEPDAGPAPPLQLQPQPQPQPEAEEAEEEQEDYNPWRDNFYDLNEDGSYIFGYSLPHGVRRWERGFYSEELHSRVVEGFYVQPRLLGHGTRYELRCYRSDINGYQPLAVAYLRRAPSVRRNEQPQVDCFNSHR